ncbi:hypothetical protein CSQ88_02590 [Iodobacter sp. BJB302]|nr:hypothetical protein CSQ88_02590 [Iodobacter sp. BJB302]
MQQLLQKNGLLPHLGIFPQKQIWWEILGGVITHLAIYPMVMMLARAGGVMIDVLLRAYLMPFL